MDANTPQSTQPQGQNRLILIVLSIFFPWVSVMLLKGCAVEAVICFLLTCLFWIPGVLYALWLILQDPESDAPLGTGLNNQIQTRYQQAPPQSYQHRAESAVDAKAPTEAAAQTPETETAPVSEKVPVVESAQEVSEPVPVQTAEKQ